MARREWWRTVLAFGLGVAAAISAACGGSTTPHQPGLCPTYHGGLSAGDSLLGVYPLVSYCIDTLPAHGPPVDTGHVTLKRATPADSIVGVFGTQGQPPLNVSGTYALSGTDSIHVSGQVSTPFGPQAVQLSGTFVLRHDTLSVSGRLTVTGAGERSLSFSGTRSGP